MYCGRNLQRVAFLHRAHRAFRVRAPGRIGRRIEQHRAPRERAVGVEDHLDFRDVGVAVRHGRRGRPAVEVALRQPRVERGGHRHRHARRVVMRQPLGRRRPLSGSGRSRRSDVLPCPMSLAIAFGSKLCDGFGFSGAGSFGRSGGASMNFGRTGGSTGASSKRELRRGRGLGSLGRHRLRRRRRVRFGRRRGFRRRGLGFGGLWRRLRRRGLRFGGRRRRGGGGVGSADARRSGGGSGGAGGGWRRGLASFSPLAIWLSSLSETVSTGMASGLSANLGAEANPSRISASSAPCIAAEPAKLQYDRRSSNAAPGYCLIGSVTRATFLNPADVTAAMISATRP